MNSKTAGESSREDSDVVPTEASEFGDGNPVPDSRLWTRLTAVHFATGVVLALLTDEWPSIRSALFFGLVFCDVVLVAVWAALGLSPWWKRLLGFGAGVGYLTLLFAFANRDYRGYSALWVVVTGSLVASLLLLSSIHYVRLVRLSPHDRRQRGEPFRFTIGHIMVLTFAVGLTIALVIRLEPLLPAVAPMYAMGMVSLMSLCYGTVGIACLWAGLNRNHPWIKSSLVLVFAGFVGCIPPLLFPWYAEKMECWMVANATQALWLLLTLALVRRAGYRVVMAN